DAVFVQFADPVTQRLHEQAHQVTDFVFRPAPVFGTEGKQGQHFHTPAGAATDHRLHSPFAGAVAFVAGQATAARPAVVAVHDDRHVARYAGRLHGINVRGL